MGASAACNNNLSEVVSVSHSLQKLLVFFMMLDAVWMVVGYGFLGPLLSFLFHFIVFSAIKRQRTGVLLVYVVLNVIVLSFAAVAMLFMIGAMMTATPMYDISSSSSDAPEIMPQAFKSMFARSFSSSSSDAPNADSTVSTVSPTAPASASASASSSYESSSSYYSSSDSYEASDVFVAGSIIFLISIIVLYCKIYSVVLAARLRRLLLATPVLPVHVTLPVGGVHTADQADSDTKPLLAEQPTYDENPMFAHPGFVPVQPQLFYPNIQGGAPSMMAPPFMYGQHPVFYTFAPAPPTDEKQ